MRLFEEFKRKWEGGKKEVLYASESPVFSGIDIKQAIDMHQTWHKQLVSLVYGNTSDDPSLSLSGRDDFCLLGQWIRGEARQRYGKLPEHLQLLKGHALFHACAGDILWHHRSGRLHLAEQILATDLRAYSESVQLDIMRLYAAASQRK